MVQVPVVKCLHFMSVKAKIVCLGSGKAEGIGLGQISLGGKTQFLCYCHEQKIG